ncbi:MAG: putative bifunctional diguanylate cyclase/phosphodiesterase [Alphaproteobacteria bacterium]
MFRKFFARDRLLMAGLVLLGIITVAAGFTSGRSTFEYALSTDARQASARWVERTEDRLFRKGFEKIEKLSEQQIVIVAPRIYDSYRVQAKNNDAEKFRIARSVHEEFGLLAGIDKLFSGWITRLTSLMDSDEHVSRVRNFAMLDPSGYLVLRSSGYAFQDIRMLLSNSIFQAELYKAMGLRATRMIGVHALPGKKQNKFRKTLIVPLIKDQKISRIYVLDIDQSSAATMSKVALVVASIMTSLLIVLGYSVPAAIAFRRIRQRWKIEDQLRYLAMHDPLTGLPNRMQLKNRLEQALARARRHNTILAIMCIDLDKFKDVNDTLGHKIGDGLLQEVSDRLRACVRETDIVARLGGDEFAIVAEDLEDPSAVLPLARRICQELSNPFEIEGHPIAISGSVGISFAPTEGSEPAVLLNNADLALYRAKNDGRSTFRFFEPEMDRAIQIRRALAGDLRHALRKNELHVHYQPQFDLRTGTLNGYEALARWNHPEKGEIEPSLFIPIAEENGLIAMLGEWVLKTACSYACDWPPNTKLSVNISSAQFVAQDLASLVHNILTQTGFPARRLLLEFTEDLLIRHPDETVKTLTQLTDMGVLLALDDFGTGYSSLSYLSRLPIAKIKIDHSFIHLMDSDKDAGAIVKSIVGLGRSLDLIVAAEGVETEDQAQTLRRMGCDEVQGYLFGRPESKVREQPQRLSPAVGALHGVAPLMRSDHIPGCIEVGAPVKIETEAVDLPLTGDVELFSGSELARLLPSEPSARALAERRLCAKASSRAENHSFRSGCEFPQHRVNTCAN